MKPPRLRFAPSPNGLLHLGHAYSALLNTHFAAKLDGEFLVRVEDIDTTRCTPELAEACLADLRWLGLAFPEPRVQSRHFADYAKALDALNAEGLLYPCFCTRADLAAHHSGTDPDGAPLYAGTCRNLTRNAITTRMQSSTPFALRLNMARALETIDAPLTYQAFDAQLNITTIPCTPERFGDVVLMRKDTPTSYHLSVVVDDAMQGITHIVRGQDLEAATDVHVLLQHILGLPTPLYHHHALLKDEDGTKLSKSRFSETIQTLRANGARPEEIVGMVKLPTASFTPPAPSPEG